ncbi:hypothetical protein [Bacillus toyonensis]|uniref:hypothetical protein n=1 Tax=Bacillus toyonensis TaxID=155322 RepID=UPI000BF4700C|nr:hypothetical protein [Bacillus toyonensis]PGF05026.1 hypothetical protein COM61_00905 [Bacillus toyonensis]
MSRLRQQVSLHFTSEKTFEYTEKLKEQKRLRTVLSTFLDKFAENPEMVERWLNGEIHLENNGVATESDEKILALKQNLAVYTAFLDNAKGMNDCNIEEFEDQLTATQFREFKTNFEKSQQIMDIPEYQEHAVTVEPIVETPKQTNQMAQMQDQINQLMTMMQNMANGNGTGNSEVKIEVTNPSHNSLHEESKTFEKSEVVSADIIKIPDETEEEVIEEPTIREEIIEEPIIEETVVEEPKKDEPVDEDVLAGVGDAMSAIEGLGIEL